MPEKRPEWLQTAVLKFPWGREAEELVPVDTAHLPWAVSLGNVDWNPHPVRRSDLDHPDELRVDIDPMPDAPWDYVRRVALLAGDVLREHGLRGFPRTSGSRGMHIMVRIQQRWDFVDRARGGAGARARGRAPRRGHGDLEVVEGGAPAGRRVRRLQPERQGPHGGGGLLGPPGARRAGGLPPALGRGARLRARDFRIDTVPERLRTVGDPSASIDSTAGSLDSLLALAQEAS